MIPTRQRIHIIQSTTANIFYTLLSSTPVLMSIVGSNVEILEVFRWLYWINKKYHCYVNLISSSYVRVFEVVGSRFLDFLDFQYLTTESGLVKEF
jgi:hypothetical protein